jgi:hypothetical protein
MLLICALQPFFLPPLPLVAPEIEHIEGSIGLTLVMELALEFDDALS